METTREAKYQIERAERLYSDLLEEYKLLPAGRASHAVEQILNLALSMKSNAFSNTPDVYFTKMMASS